jgi:hypothetical protein
MNDEQQFNEIEKTMFDLSGACRRARRTIEGLQKGNAPEHLIEAMRTVLVEMEASHKRLMQGTYWAVPEMRAGNDAAQDATSEGASAASPKRFVSGAAVESDAQTTLI